MMTAAAALTVHVLLGGAGVEHGEPFAQPENIVDEMEYLNREAASICPVPG